MSFLKKTIFQKTLLEVLSFFCGKTAVACYQKSSKLKGPDSLQKEKFRFPYSFEGPPRFSGLEKFCFPHPCEESPLRYGLVERKSAGVRVHLQGPAKAILGAYCNTKITFLFPKKLR